MGNDKKTLSIAIAVFNEEKNLEACLTSIRDLADEIVVVDGGSTDNTVKIAQKFTKKIIRTDNPFIFHINKQKAVDMCSCDWILQLDADEIIPEALKNEIIQTIHDEQISMNGFYIPRRNYFLGKWMKKGGLYPDYVIRLFRMGKGRFPSKSVHEQIEIEGPAGYLKEPMDHFTSRTKEEYWKKADIYTTLTAMEMKKNGVIRNAWNWFLYTIIKPKLIFLSLFIRHKGFMDGWRGLLFAYFSALHFPIAYNKFNKMVVLLVLFFLCALPARAEYVLPYPSYMPGNKLYSVTRVLDTLKNYWYFGTIAQAKYHWGLSDKYLVEAKTLFEYKQYLLAVDALKRSDEHFKKAPKNVEEALKHTEVLTFLVSTVPETFTWTPEQAKETILPLKSLLESSIALRKI